MTATDELRRLLDERGVKYYDMQNRGIWFGISEDGKDHKYEAFEQTDGLIEIDVFDLTPEQAIAATLGSGTLTAEQVRETVEKHWHNLSADYDMPEATALPEYSYDWQAIADELNATLGSGTCKQVLTDCDDGLMPPFTAHCSACGAEWGFTPKYCHHCGAKVTGTRDERKAVNE